MWQLGFRLTLYRVFPLLAEFSPYHPSYVIPCLSLLEIQHKKLFQNGVHQPVLWRKRTDDEADNFVAPRYDRLKLQLCVFEGFVDVQTVEIDRSTRETLTSQRELSIHNFGAWMRLATIPCSSD